MKHTSPSTGWMGWMMVGDAPVAALWWLRVVLVVVEERKLRKREGKVLEREKDIKTDGKEGGDNPKSRESENRHCVRVFIRFTEFPFGLNMSLHPGSKLNVLIVNLERFQKTHAAVKFVLRNNAVQYGSF